MSDVIEKVARAMCAIEENGNEDWWEDYVPHAESAIAALADHFDKPPLHTVAFNSDYETTARRLRSLLKESK